MQDRDAWPRVQFESPHRVGALPHVRETNWRRCFKQSHVQEQQTRAGCTNASLYAVGNNSGNLFVNWASSSCADAAVASGVARATTLRRCEFSAYPSVAS